MWPLGDQVSAVTSLFNDNVDHGDVKYSIGNVVNNIVITVWCQVGI